MQFFLIPPPRRLLLGSGLFLRRPGAHIFLRLGPAVPGGSTRVSLGGRIFYANYTALRHTCLDTRICAVQYKFIRRLERCNRTSNAMVACTEYSEEIFLDILWHRRFFFVLPVNAIKVSKRKRPCSQFTGRYNGVEEADTLARVNLYSQQDEAKEAAKIEIIMDSRCLSQHSRLSELSVADRRKFQVLRHVRLLRHFFSRFPIPS